MIFYNELLSVILRTIWSVILQSPKHLLQEIILVDDASTDGWLNYKLYIKKILTINFRVVEGSFGLLYRNETAS